MMKPTVKQWASSRTFAMTLAILLAGLSCAVPNPSVAQDSPTVAQNPQTAPQQSSVPPVSVSVSPAGIQRFVNDGWASLAVVGINRTEADHEEVVSVFMGKDSHLQFSKSFWIPANSRRQTWLPVRIPSKTATGGKRVLMSMIRLQESEDGETFGDNVNDEPIFERSMMLVNQEINSAIIGETSGLDEGTRREKDRLELMALIDTARDSTTSEPSVLPVANLLSSFLPSTQGALDQLDQLVIAGDNLVHDTHSIAQLRSWIRDGGRVWIMLDLTSQEFIDQLLGDDVCYSTVNQVELNELQIEYIDPFTKQVRTTVPWSSETPVVMHRVLADVDDIPCRVNGWPAAFWKPIGDGEVLFTTLGGNGWIRNDSGATIALNHLAKRFFEPRNEPDSFAQAMRPVVDARIGYEIPSRTLAGVILGGNTLVILLAGIWWARQRRLERMAILVPISAAITTGILMLIGTRHAGSVPSTVATAQVVQIDDATQEADVSMIQAVYSQQSSELALVSRGPVFPMPIDDDGATQTHRIRLDEGGSSRWIAPEQPPGVVRHYAASASLPLQHPIAVDGTFGPDGFTGNLKGLDGAQCSDAVIVSDPAPRTAAKIKLDGDTVQINAASESLLPSDQFIPGAILSDQQRSRQQFLRNCFDPSSSHSLGAGPALLVWTQPMDMGLQFADEFQRGGEALVSIPIQITRPQTDQPFQIPATFIQVDTYQGANGRSSVFDPRTGKWLQELTKATEAELILKFPPSLGEIRLDRVSVSMKINAPMRTVTIKALVDGKPTAVFTRDNPTGLLKFDINRQDALKLQPEGLWLSVGISESTQAKKVQQEVNQDQALIDDRVVDNATWQIDHLFVNALGRIVPNPSL